jgi:hypothetical protein
MVSKAMVSRTINIRTATADSLVTMPENHYHEYLAVNYFWTHIGSKAHKVWLLYALIVNSVQKEYSAAEMSFSKLLE